MLIRHKIILILSVIIILLLGVLIFSARPLVGDLFHQDEALVSDISKNQPSLLIETYQWEIKILVSEIDNLLNWKEARVEEWEAIKQKLLAIKTPTEFKDLHLSLVLAVGEAKDFAALGAEEKIITARELLEKIKNNYPWLSN